MQYGDQDIQLSALEQLVDKSQTRAVAEALKWLQAQLSQQQQQQQGGTLLERLQGLEELLDRQVRGPLSHLKSLLLWCAHDSHCIDTLQVYN